MQKFYKHQPLKLDSQHSFISTCNSSALEKMLFISKIGKLYRPSEAKMKYVIEFRVVLYIKDVLVRVVPQIKGMLRKDDQSQPYVFMTVNPTKGLQCKLRISLIITKLFLSTNIKELQRVVTNCLFLQRIARVIYKNS